MRGFKNWRHACGNNQGFLKHEKTKLHKRAQIAFEEYSLRLKSASSVLQVIDKPRNETIKQNREKLTKIISALHFCAKQMIAFRGHTETES